HWAVITSSSQSGAAPRWTRRSPRPATKAARMQRSRRSGRGVTIANVPGSRLSAPAPVSSSTPSRRRRSGGALLGAAAFFAVAGAIAYRAVEWTRVYGHPWSRWAFCDFRTVVYYPAVAFLAGDNPYDAAAFTRTYPAPFEFPPYSPLTILLHLPFALLPVGAAAVAYFATILGLTLAIAAMALRLGGLAATVPRIFVVGTLALLSRPGQANLIGGQVAATATVACYTALWWSRSRPRRLRPSRHRRRNHVGDASRECRVDEHQPPRRGGAHRPAPRASAERPGARQSHRGRARHGRPRRPPAASPSCSRAIISTTTGSCSRCPWPRWLPGAGRPHRSRRRPPAGCSSRYS